MKYLKKWGWSLVFLAALLCVLCGSAFAAQSSSGTLTISSDPAPTLAAGESFSVTVYAEGSKGLSGISLSLGFDTDVLTLCEITSNQSGFAYNQISDNAVSVNIRDANVRTGTKIEVCTLSFVVKPYMVVAEVANNTIQTTEAKSGTLTVNEYAIYDDRMREYIDVTESMGEISVLPAGDVNGDGKITIIDASRIARYLVNVDEATKERLIPSHLLKFADVNDDGQIKINDAATIQRFLNNAITYDDAQSKSFIGSYVEVTFMVENGAPQTILANRGGNLLSSAPTVAQKPGKVFDGWATQSEPQTIIDLDEIKKPFVLYPQYSPIRYGITYHNVDAQEHTNPATYTAEDATYTLLDAHRNGCRFEGWYTDAALQHSATQIVAGTTGEQHFYAKWSVENYRIYYHLNDGTLIGQNPETYTIFDTVVLQGAQKVGYTFAGWYADQNLTVPTTGITEGTVGEQHFYAAYDVITYSVTFKVDGNTVDTQYYTIENKAVTVPEVPEKAGYTGAWESYTLDLENIEVNAVYTVIPYNIVYENTTAHSNPATYNIESATIVLQAPASKTGYNFAGWTCNGEPITEIPIGSIGNKTIVANWELETYTIQYVLPLGAITTNPTSYTIETDLITLTDAAMGCYVFEGWYQEETFQTPITILADGAFGNVIIYGKFGVEEHRGEPILIKHIDSHYQVCSFCYEQITVAEGHTIEDGACTECGFNPTITATSVETVSGATQVAIAVSITDNPGIAGLTATVQYSSDVFTLVQARGGEALNVLTFTAPSTLNSGCTFMWDGLEINDKDIKDGEVLILIFDIAVDAPEGEYSILLNINAFDNDLSRVNLRVVGGKVTINNN